jgi:hypothetical protein
MGLSAGTGTGFRALEVLDRGAELLFLFEELGETDPEFRGLCLDLCEAQGQLPLAGGCLGGAPLGAVALADVLQAVGGLLPDAVPLRPELLAPDVVQPPAHPLVRE